MQTYSHEDPNMQSNNEAQLYGLVEPVHPQILASSSQVFVLLKLSCSLVSLKIHTLCLLKMFSFLDVVYILMQLKILIPILMCTTIDVIIL